MYNKKQSVMEKLKNFNSNYEESKKAFGNTDTNQNSEKTSTSASTSAKKTAASAEAASKTKELYNSICQCGKPAPKFK